MSLEILGARELAAKLAGIPAKLAKVRERQHYNMATIVRQVAKRYSPISPSVGQLKAMRKTKRKVTTSKRATSRPARGALQAAISSDSNADRASIFVAANSSAGKYAVKIHDEKGLTWNKRGPGTVAKGPFADHKFIERAAKDSEADLMRACDAAVSEAWLKSLD